MIGADDILCLKYTPDLTEGGIAHACRSLPHKYSRAGRASHDQLLDAIAEFAVEIAFRRHLAQANIPFSVKAATSFGETDTFDLVLAGHRCLLSVLLIRSQKPSRSIETNLGHLLTATALVPVQKLAAEGRSLKDLFLFAFVTGTIADSGRRSTNSQDAGACRHLVFAMPGRWAHPRAWVPLEPLAFKCDQSETLRLEIGGQDRDGNWIVSSLLLPPRTRTELDADFHAVTCLHIETLPQGRLGVGSASWKTVQIIEPADWHNIWLEGTGIYLAGWMTREQFGIRGRAIPQGSRVFPYGRIWRPCLGVNLSELRPVAQLLGSGVV